MRSLLTCIAIGLFALLAAAACSDGDGTSQRTPTTLDAISTPATDLWVPAPGTSWQWQLSGEVDLSVDAGVWDIDMFENDTAVVATLHERGARVVCYISAGTWEEPRPDAGEFPDEILGEPLDNYPDERWLDVRQIDALAPIMEARLDQCRDKGFDGVEFDNVDGYDNDSGFPLSYDDQLAYNRYLAGQAHERGLSAALKNDLEQVADLLPYFEFAVNEQCFQYDECDLLTPFIDAGKAVFEVEYELETDEFCDQALDLGLSAMRKNGELDAYKEGC